MATATTRQQENTRTVVALMIVTVVFALIGHEINAVNAADKTANQKPGSDPVTVGGRIILGGTIATFVLVLISHAGEPGRNISLGLAVITTATVTLTYSGPVWSTVSNIAAGSPGNKPTGGSGSSGSTSPTNPTNPTRNPTATAVAFTNVL